MGDATGIEWCDATYNLPSPSTRTEADQRVACLQPSTQPALTLQQLQRLPVGMIVLVKTDLIFSGDEWRVVKIAAPQAGRLLETVNERDCWAPQLRVISADAEVRLPMLPRLSCRMTESAVRERRKTVTRRLKTPTWCKPGVLALLVDKVRCKAANGLAVVEIVAVRREPLSKVHHGWATSSMMAISETELEGFPGMSRDEFIAMFVAAQNCGPETEVTRIEWRYL